MPGRIEKSDSEGGQDGVVSNDGNGPVAKTMAIDAVHGANQAFIGCFKPLSVWSEAKLNKTRVGSLKRRIVKKEVGSLSGTNESAGQNKVRTIRPQKVPHVPGLRYSFFG
jgi:hypothetical protein